MDSLTRRLESMTPLQRAVFALKETQARLDLLQQQRTEPIAIVGMACRFPGGANDAEAFWRLICDRVDAIREVPPDRWNADAFYDPDPTAPGKMNTRWGGFLEHIDEFDNHFFGISDREAARIDPQQRMLLELAWESLEDAGLPPGMLRGTRTGVFIGIGNCEYLSVLSKDRRQTDGYAAAGTALCLAANRMSFAFGWQGPSIALDTACSSSVVAVHMACQNIRGGECETALAGGANLLLTPFGSVNLTKAGFSSSDGRIRAFDAAATGYVRSEGAGLLVLKSLSAALRDKDPIRAVILGSAVNQNGSSNGLTAPSRPAQEQVLREAYSRAKVSPGQIQYVETQGTGTRLGDAMEAAALGNVLREGRAPDSRCAIGSVKTNIGHLESASGIASLMKATLALEHRQMPPSLHFETPSPDIAFNELPIRVQRELEPWPDPGGPRLAGVSAFGFGGSNAHLVLQEAPATGVDAPIATGPIRLLLPLSARTEKALDELVRRYIELLRGDAPPWRDVCHTAARRRDHHDCRLAVLAGSCAEAADLLDAALRGASRPEIFRGRKPFGRDLRVAFLYDGQPEAWAACLSRLTRTVPQLAETLKELDWGSQAALGGTLTDAIVQGDGAVKLAAKQPTLLAIQCAMSAWWRKAGVVPAAVLGRGVGELAAACTAGILTADDALRVAADGDAVGAGSRCAALPFLSALDGQSHRGPELAASHWRACLQGATGWDAAVASLAQRQFDVYLEIGVGSLVPSVSPRVHDQPSTALVASSLSPSGDGRPDVLAAIGTLYAAGADIAWKQLAPLDGRHVRLPTYPWQRQRLWAAPKSCETLQAEPVAEASDDTASERTSDAATQLRERSDLTTPYVAPRTPLEEQLTQAWQEVLKLDRVGIHDNFFELGGDSLLVTVLLNRLQEHMDVDLPLRDMYQTPTVAALAAGIEAAGADGTRRRREPIPRVPREGHLAPSLTQEALWFLAQLEPDRPTYTVYPALRIRGRIEVPILERAFNEIARRHEALRTRFPEIDGRPVQVIDPPEFRAVSLVDLSGLPEDQREPALQQWIEEEAQRPINLQTGPLLRATLLRLSAEEHVFLAAAHHIIYDGWSLAVMSHELTTLYKAFGSGLPSPLPELPIQYADFAAWQRQFLQGETLDRLQSYWSKQLAGVPPLELPTDLPRPAVATTRGSTLPCNLSAELSAAVREFCRREGVTPFMALLAAFEMLLARYAGQEDFAIGSPVANRMQPETERLIGCFINMVVLRNDLSGDPGFREVVRRVRKVALDAYEHQELTLDQVVGAVRPPRDPSRHPLFQAMFVLQNNEPASLAGLGWDVELLDDVSNGRLAFFELTLGFGETSQGFRGSLNFNTDLFRPDTIERMALHYQVLLAEALRDPDCPMSSLTLLREGERREILVDWNRTADETPRDACIHELFERQARATPTAIALVEGPRQWTYDELDREANRLAHHLQSLGALPDRLVGVRLPRSGQWAIAILAVLKAGAAYLPLDPDLPAERLRFALADAGVDVVVTLDRLRKDLPEGLLHVVCMDVDHGRIAACPEHQPERATTPDQLAYVIYTSGSTGRPKGVMIEHRALVNYTSGAAAEYRITAADRVLQFASASYDAHVEEVYPTWTRGATLVLRNDEMLDCKRFVELCDAWRLTLVTLPTGFWNELTSAIRSEGLVVPGTLRTLVIGGERAMPQRVAQWLECVGDRVRLLNTYGPTETTVVATSTELGHSAGIEERVPIGRPLANMLVYVLDARLQPVPVGVRGELYIGGESLARGYLNRPELTAERFLPDPFSQKPGARMYKTGDVVRWRPDGQLDFIGRTDHQVKIRGFRIEPGEVERVLGEHPSVAEVAVVASERTPGDLQLVAYVAPHAGQQPAAAELRLFLAQRLPEFMIPALLILMDALPVNTSGKVDRRALPAPDWSQSARDSQYVAPRTETERQMATVWAEILNVSEVGLQDDFFTLGGNSLLALRLVSRVRMAFAIDLPLVTLFTSPTLGAFAERIAAIRAAEPLVEQAPIRPRTRSGPVPISISQERYWAVHQRFAGMPLLNQHAAMPLLGELNPDALRDTINELVRRHEALRTTIVASGDELPVQVIAPELHVDLPVEDLTSLPQQEQDDRVRAISEEQAAKAFDLSELPLFRVRLLRLGPMEHVIIVTIHHLISDGWTIEVILHEIAQIYDAFCSGRPSPLPALSIQYADFAVWQRETMQGPALASLMGYWRNRLAGVGRLDLPADRPRRHDSQPLQRHRDFHVPVSLEADLNGVCRREHVTMFMLSLAAFKTLLCRYTGMGDIAVITNVANRQRQETHSMIGLLTNMVVLRSDLSGDPPFREALARVRKTALEAYDHQEVPLECLVKELLPGHDWATLPFSNIWFNYHQRTTADQVPRREGLGLGYRPTQTGPMAARSEITLRLTETNNGLKGELLYDSSLFDDDRMEQLEKDYVGLLEQIVADSSRRLSELRLEDEAGPRETLPEAATLEAVAASLIEETPRGARSLVPLRAGGTATPLFFIHGLGGHVAGFLPIARGLNGDRPVYAFQGQGLSPGTMPDDDIVAMATAYLREMRTAQPRGPYLLSGWSLGGLIALEVGRQLVAAGDRVAGMVLLDTWLSITGPAARDLDDRTIMTWIAGHLQIPAGDLRNLPIEDRWDRIADQAQRVHGIMADDIRRLALTCRAHLVALKHYVPQTYPGRVLLLRASRATVGLDPQWATVCPQLQVESVPGNHYTMLRKPEVDVLIERMDRYLHETAVDGKTVER